MTASFGLEGHRADIVIFKTARALAAFENRTEITGEDISRAAELAIPHRIVSDHTSGGEIPQTDIGKKAAEILSSLPKQAFPNSDPELFDDKKKAGPILHT